MMNWMPSRAATVDRGFSPFRFLGSLVVLVFALIQAVLIGRILVDLGVIPADGSWGEAIITYSDILAAPVQGVGSGIGAMFGGGGMEMVAGQGLDGAIVVALVGWSVVEGLVMRVVRKLEQV